VVAQVDNGVEAGGAGADDDHAAGLAEEDAGRMAAAPGCSKMIAGSSRLPAISQTFLPKLVSGTPFLLSRCIVDPRGSPQWLSSRRLM
jgi:hypothetical protein